MLGHQIKGVVSKTAASTGLCKRNLFEENSNSAHEDDRASHCFPWKECGDHRFKAVAFTRFYETIVALIRLTALRAPISEHLLEVSAAD